MGRLGEDSMSTEAGRTSYGMTDKGQVVVIEFTTNSDNGTPNPSTYQVRHGVRTVLETANEQVATNAAKAIAAA